MSSYESDRSDSEPAPPSPPRGKKRAAAPGRGGLLTINGERLSYCVPAKQPTWFVDFVPWMDSIRDQLPVKPSMLGKRIHDAKSFKPLQTFFKQLFPLYVEVGKLRAPPKPRAPKASAKNATTSSPSNNGKSAADEGGEHPASPGSPAAADADTSQGAVPPAAKKARRMRVRVPRARIAAMKEDAAKGLELLLAKSEGDVEATAAAQSIANIVREAILSMEQTAMEETPEP